jgi:hypothetical protein
MRFLRSCFLRSCFSACLVLLVLVGGAAAQPAPPAPSPPDTAALRTIEAQVAQLRGLTPLAEPDLHILNHTALEGYLADQLAQNYLPSERDADHKELAALGFIQPTDDLVQIELELLNNQVVGIYDPDSRSMFVVADQGSFDAAARITYAHEFNHALQDQYYGLSRLAPKHPENIDRSLAVRGLIEGDSILLQSLWAQQHLSRDELLQLVSDTSSDTGLAAAPLLVRSELLFPYTDGFNFVRQIYRQAGNSYAAVDAVFANPPLSTAQVLHPEKYRAQVRPIEVELPDLASSFGAGWHPVGRGVLGELETRLLLEQWGTPRAETERIAAGWAGDGWQMIESDGRSAFVYRSTWSSSTAAQDFYRAHTRGLRVRFASATVDEAGDTREVLSTPDTATDVSLRGSDVVTVIASDRDTANAALASVTSSSTASAV